MKRWLVLGSVAMVSACTREPSHAPVPENERRTVAVDLTLARRALQPIVAPRASSPRLVDLGERLFHEPRLSNDGAKSCATCHDLQHYGIDGDGYEAAHGNRIDTPTVFNAALNPHQFWDGRVDSLEQQIDGPLLDAREMGSSWQQVLGLLARDQTYRSEFDALFDDGVTADNVREALTAFERTLVTVDSPFDHYLRGEVALEASVDRGYQLFVKEGCASCHQGANVGGNLFERLGEMRALESVREPGPLDRGRGKRTARADDERVFRVPSLRLAIRTAPYFHDGSVATLDEAIDQMGKLQLGVELKPAERRDIAHFLESLVGEYEGRHL